MTLWPNISQNSRPWVTPAAQRRAGARVRLHAGSGPHEGTPTASGTSSRRTLLNKVVALPALVAATVAPRGAYAKGGPASPAELKRMKDGYDGLNVSKLLLRAWLCERILESVGPWHGRGFTLTLSPPHVS